MMQKYARIEGGMVVELLSTDGDISEMFHPSLEWVPCTEEVLPGDAYNEGVFSRPEAEPPEQPVPPTVTRFQARAALLEAGLLDAVETYFSGLPDSSLDKLAWKEAPSVSRGSDALKGASVELGISEAQVDALFRRAIQFI